jgi:hypothetical protein
MEGDATIDTAIENAVRTGISQADAEAEILAGTNGLHVFMWVGDYSVYNQGTVRLKYASCLTAWGKEPLFWSRANLKVVDTPPVCGYVGQTDFERACIAASDDMWTPIWDKVARSDFYDKFGIGGTSLLAGYDDTADDEIPYGVGLVPSKAGSLVGVVKAGRDFYVWRKTNETVTAAIRDDVDEVPDKPYGFEHAPETHFVGWRSLTYLLFDQWCIRTVAWPFPMSPFNVSGGRQITGALRPLPDDIVEGASEDGHETGEEFSFARPFFVMGGRQRYLQDS